MPEAAKPWRAAQTPPRHRQQRPLPSLLKCIALILDDACPPDPAMQLCCMIEDDDGSSCRLCWLNYARYVDSGRQLDAYKDERLHEGGLKP